MLNTIVNGESDVYGLVGYPVSHTFSPVIHNTISNKLGLNNVYVPFLVDIPDLEKALQGALSLDIKGLNVTIPHKVDVLNFCGDVDKLALEIGAANTLVKSSKGFKGFKAYNTDYLGVLKSFQIRDISLKDKNVLIIGAGGTANAISILMCYEEVRNLFIANRTVRKAVDLKKNCGRYYSTNVVPMNLQDMVNIKDVDIIINTTSVEMKGHNESLIPIDMLKSNHIVFDVIYNPWETQLLKDAKSKGCVTFNGFDMLVYQGIYSFEIWNDITVGDDVCLEIRNELMEHYEKTTKE